MVFKVTMNGVASYKQPATLESDKKVTLIYGLNGTGKSTFSNYLYEPTNHRFGGCRQVGFEDAHVYVYNSNFVRDNFYEVDKLSGIFTLSKANKDVELQIENKSKTLNTLNSDKKNLTAALETADKKLAGHRAETEDAAWKIKTKYSGGDRVLEYCLRGLMQSKGRLFDHLFSLHLPDERPVKTIEILRSEVEAIQGNQAKAHALIPKLTVVDEKLEKDPILQQIIVGNQDSPVAGLIKKLGSADWVSEGIPYIDLLQAEGDPSCPFCQAKTLTETVANTIKSYFDETFESSMTELKKLQSRYNGHVDSQPKLEDHLSNPFIAEKRQELEALYGQLSAVWKANKDVVERKLKSPSAPVTLADTKGIAEAINTVIDSVNAAITAHNDKIENKEKALDQIRTEFWNICRYEYDSVIEVYKKYVEEHKRAKDTYAAKLATINQELAIVAEELSALQKRTVNIDDAIGVINSRLGDLGIDSFRIIKTDGNRYRISRNGTAAEDFLSLSEGEKTVISFLYFVELCKGKRSPTEIGWRKIVAIDDPISSLSHIYIFNIGQLIKDEFSNSEKFEHVIILTHSLYFFYEMADMNKDRRDKTQKLTRIVKSSAGSRILDMKYEEVQNDYQAYWSVIRDEEQHPALIANSMRNVIEYFFNFVKKIALSAVFQQPGLKDPKHQAFCRFMNRESHSLGQNIFDLKEFDYEKFREAFKLVFDETGFSDHYKAMTK